MLQIFIIIEMCPKWKSVCITCISMQWRAAFSVNRNVVWFKGLHSNYLTHQIFQTKFYLNQAYFLYQGIVSTELSIRLLTACIFSYWETEVWTKQNVRDDYNKTLHTKSKLKQNQTSERFILLDKPSQGFSIKPKQKNYFANPCKAFCKRLWISNK